MSRKPGSPSPASSYDRIYAVVARIPEGKVATYGQVAALAGLPGHARQVGYALHATPEDSDLPWQRVINAKGEISLRGEPGIDGYQRHLLAEEGVEIDLQGRVDLKRFRWEPEEAPGGRPRRSPSPPKSNQYQPGQPQPAKPKRRL